MLYLQAFDRMKEIDDRGSIMIEKGAILIIDDEVGLRVTLGAVLQRAGYQVSTAADAQEALNILINSAFDLIFLDLAMPGMNGMDLLPELRQKYPEIPVIVLTANISFDTANEAFKRGANGYLLKPVFPHDILTRVQDVMTEHHEKELRKKIIIDIHDMLDSLNRP